MSTKFSLEHGEAFHFYADLLEPNIVDRELLGADFEARPGWVQAGIPLALCEKLCAVALKPEEGGRSGGWVTFQRVMPPSGGSVSSPQGAIIMSEVVQGVIHGRTIELKADPGITDGATVEVTIRPVPETDPRIAAILRTAGSMANHAEFDAAMDEVERYRRSAQFRETPE